jgi:hypothetical protein
MPGKAEAEPILPISIPPPTPQPILSAASRSKLAARRYLPSDPSAGLSEKSKGKQRADVDFNNDVDAEQVEGDIGGEGQARRGRAITIIFSNEDSGKNLDLWIEEGESVGSVKDQVGVITLVPADVQIRHLRPRLLPLQLRLIHSGRLLTDGILLLPWLRALEQRVKRQAAGMTQEVEEVLKDVGLGEEADKSGGQGVRTGVGEDKIWLHCNVGAEIAPKESPGEEVEPEVRTHSA